MKRVYGLFKIKWRIDVAKIVNRFMNPREASLQSLSSNRI